MTDLETIENDDSDCEYFTTDEIHQEILMKPVSQLSPEALEFYELTKKKLKQVLIVASEMTQESWIFNDQILCTAYQIDKYIKFLNVVPSTAEYAEEMQKRWWRDEDNNTDEVEVLLDDSEPHVFKAEYDPLLDCQHRLTPPDRRSRVENTILIYRKYLNARREDKKIIRDSEYFVREWFLPKKLFTVGKVFASEIPLCYPPPMMRRGYFPKYATSRNNKVDYLVERFEEAQLEYSSFMRGDIAQPEGFRQGSITSEELYEFHKSGRHIHGFFFVLESEEIDETFRVRKRYLVDMFNFLRFPLYVEFDKWEYKLKATFDRVCIFNLHLAEAIRANIIVFSILPPETSIPDVYLYQELPEDKNRWDYGSFWVSDAIQRAREAYNEQRFLSQPMLVAGKRSKVAGKEDAVEAKYSEPIFYYDSDESDESDEEDEDEKPVNQKGHK